MINPERPWNDAFLAAEAKRLADLATAAKCHPDEITVEKLAEFGVMPADATPENIGSAGARAAKLAHDEAAIGAELPPEKARAIAFAVRGAHDEALIAESPEKANAVATAKASELVTRAVQTQVAEALEAVAKAG